MTLLTHSTNPLLRLLMLLALFFPALAPAATVWVDDEIIINVRSGKGNEFRIIKNAGSGTAFELIGEEDEWSHVRYKDIDGWVRTQYLSKTPVAEHLLASANKNVTKLKDQNQKLRQEVDTLKKELSSLGKTHRQLEKEQKTLTRDYDKAVSVAKEPLKIDNLNKKLNEKNTLLAIELEQTKAEVVRLESDTRNEGYRWGAATIIFGLFLGWLLPRLSSKKQSSGWT